MRQFTIVLTAFLLLTGCKPEATSQTPDNTETTQKEDHGHHQHDHDANAHMNSRSFEELVTAFDDPEREKWQRPHIVIAALQDLKGKTVADIGAGSGYFTFRLLEKAEKVIAVDIDDRFLNHIQAKADSMSDGTSEKLETRKSEPEDPKLEANELDVVLIVNTFHHINNRVDYLKKVKAALKPGGRLVIVDFKKGDLPVGPPDKMKIGEMDVQSELMQSGFRTVSSGKLLEHQYFLTAYN